MKRSTATSALSLIALLSMTGYVLVQSRQIRDLRDLNAQLLKRLSSTNINHLPVPALAPSHTGGASLAPINAEIAGFQGGKASSWEGRAAELRDFIKKHPEFGIPELQLATDDDWLKATIGTLDDEEGFRRALATIRNTMIAKVAHELSPALTEYIKDNNGTFPNSPTELARYLTEPLDSSILEHYQIVPSSTIKNVKMGGGSVMTQVNLIDSQYDSQFVIGPNGWGSTSTSYSQPK